MCNKNIATPYHGKSIAMKKIFILLLTISALKGFAQQTVITADNVEKRTLSGSFTAIKVSNGIELFITQGGEESVAVSASDEKYLEKFKTVVENGTLKIYMEKSDFNWVNTGRRKLKAFVSFKVLEKLHASSGAEVQAKSVLKLPYLEMDFSSGASFTGRVETDALTVEQNSGAEITLTGSAEKATLSLNSGATFSGYDFATAYCDAKATSGAGIRITVNKEINAKANSGGGIKFKGSGGIKDLSVNSGGSVKRVS